MSFKTALHRLKLYEGSSKVLVHRIVSLRGEIILGRKRNTTTTATTATIRSLHSERIQVNSGS